MVLMRSLLQTLWEAASPALSPSFRFPVDWSDRDFEMFVQLAIHHRVAPLLAHHSQHGRLPVFAEPWMQALQRELHKTRLRHVAGVTALDRLRDAFRGAGIRHAALKGPQLADEAYASQGLRPFDDLDLLVEPGQVSQAHRTMAELGYDRLSMRIPGWLTRRYHFHSQWVHPPSGQCVEIHWRPADRRILLSRSDSGSYVRDLLEEPAAMPVYLAVHIQKHCPTHTFWRKYGIDPVLALHPWSDIRLIWLLDFQGLCAARNLSTEALQCVADRWNAGNALAFAQYLVAARGDRASPFLLDLPRYSLKSVMLRRQYDDFQRAAALTVPPWWLRANRHTGFRPIRLLDILETGKQ